jgi:hypothetical protein
MGGDGRWAKDDEHEDDKDDEGEGEKDEDCGDEAP